ncbi:MAG: F0F1 ATP synthase subunit B' [Shimia sp.]
MATDTLGEGAASACVDAGGGAIGMPQLCGEWFGNQIFWLVLTILAIFFILSRIALPRIQAVLAERAGTITNDLAAAEDLKRRAEAAEAAYEKALADARAESQKIADETRASVQADLDKQLAKADAEISARTAESEAKLAEIRAGAAESVRQVANDTAQAIIAALGGNANDDAVAAAVDKHAKG